MTLLPFFIFLTVLTVAVVTTANARTQRYRGHPSIAVCTVFGRAYCLQALKVVDCESHFDVNARNGSHEGLFQMGSWARSHYGDGDDAWEQSRAAYRYFLASGHDWSPWECQP